MKKIILFSVLSALSLSGMAQSTQQVETITISKSVTEIEAPDRTYWMPPERFYQFLGSYDLANGQTLSLFERGTFKYAQVSDQPRHRIVATGKNTFVALDRQLKMRIDLKEDGEASGELYMVVPAAPATPKVMGKMESRDSLQRAG